MLIFLFFIIGMVGLASADEAAKADSPGVRMFDLQPSQAQVESFDVEEAPAGTKTLLKSLIVEIVPEEFEETKKWGRTKKVWDGLHMKMDGLELKTKRRWKEANHGTWKMHRVSLVDPDQYLRAQVNDIQKHSLGKLSFELMLAAKLDVYGRMQEWQRGVRLFSISGDATADVEIRTRFLVETKLDVTTIPPGLIIKPTAEAASIRLVNFELHRVSKASGPVVRELGDGLEKMLRRELADHNEKIVERINRQLVKKEDDLKLSVQDLFKKKWLGLDQDGGGGKDAN